MLIHDDDDADDGGNPREGYPIESSTEDRPTHPGFSKSRYVLFPKTQDAHFVSLCRTRPPQSSSQSWLGYRKLVPCYAESANGDDVHMDNDELFLCNLLEPPFIA